MVTRTISSFQVRDVELRYTARSAGPVEEVYACHIFGMAQPLGFAIKAKNRVRVEFQWLHAFTFRGWSRLVQAINRPRSHCMHPRQKESHIEVYRRNITVEIP